MKEIKGYLISDHPWYTVRSHIACTNCQAEQQLDSQGMMDKRAFSEMLNALKCNTCNLSENEINELSYIQETPLKTPLLQKKLRITLNKRR